LEHQAVPTVTVVTEAFEPLARAIASSLDMPRLPLLVMPIHLSYISTDDVLAALDERWDMLERALIRRSADGERA
jgi:hypothetical protein